MRGACSSFETPQTPPPNCFGRSGDSTARIWDLGPRPEGTPQHVVVLKHSNSKNEKAKDVTTLDWSGDGSLLATGSYDGLARIWTRGGAPLAHPPCCLGEGLCMGCSTGPGGLAEVLGTLHPG